MRIKNDFSDNEENSKLLKEGDELIKGRDNKIEVSFVVEQDESKESKKAAIISLYELPKYKNFFITVHPFIIHGYRIHHSLSQCLKSIFAMHNETLNIWTHLIPFFIFLGVFIYNLIGIYLILLSRKFIQKLLDNLPVFIHHFHIPFIFLYSSHFQLSFK